LAFLVVKSGGVEDAGKIFTLSKDSTVVGRRSTQFEPDIDLNDEVVSRKHLEILLRDQKYMLRDLNSTNGTMLDDDRIIPGNLYLLKHNSRIGLGLEGDSARVVLVFKESETTNIIDRRKASPARPRLGWLKIDERKKEVWVDGKLQKLSRKEYDLMLFLYSNASNICSRDEIIQAVWPESHDPAAISDATIDQLVHRLREKVEPEPARPARIISKKAFGYMLA